MESVSPIRSRANLIEVLAALLVVAALFFVIFGSTLHAELNVIDDHDLIMFAATGQVHPQLQPVSHALSFFDNVGRFRPIYSLSRIEGAQILGADPHLWHLVTLIEGVITCWFLYLAARKFGADILSSTFLVLWVIATRDASEIWVRMGPSETVGMLFTALALWALAHVINSKHVYRWDAGWLIFMTLAALSKETFLVLFPALLLLRWLLRTAVLNRDGLIASVRQALPVLIAGSVIFAVLLVIVLKTFQPGAYTASVTTLSVQSLTPGAWYTQLAALSPLAAYFVPVLVFLVLAASFQTLGNWKVLIAGVIFFVWIVPQFVLYPSGMFNSRYVYPTMLALAAVNAFALAALIRHRLRIISALVVLVSVVIIAQPLLGTLNYAMRFTATTQALHQMIQAVAHDVQANQVVVVASNPAAQWEASYSQVNLLGYQGLKVPIYLYPASMPDESDVANTQFAESLINNPVFAGHNDVSKLTPGEVGAIIVLTPVDEFLKNPPTWFNPNQWTMQTFSQPIMVLSQSGYRQTGDASQFIFVPKVGS